MKIYLYYNKQINVFYLPENISGSYSFDADPEEVSKLINIDAKEGKWVLFETDDCKILSETTMASSVPIEEDHFYIIMRNNANYLIYVTDNDDETRKAYTYKDNFQLIVGGETPTVKYTCPFAKDLSFQIMKSDNGLVLEWNSGSLYINKMRFENSKYLIKNGDEIEFFGVKLLFLKNTIIIFAHDDLFQVDEQACKFMRINIKNTEDIENIEAKDKVLYGEEDYFSKSPRLRRIIEKKKIEIVSPPATQPTQELPLILTIGPMFTMAVSSIVMISSSISQLTSGVADFSQVGGSLLIGVMMIASTLLWPILIRVFTKRAKARNEKKALDKYDKYLSEKEEELIKESKLQKEIIKENVISVASCLENLKHRKLNFWDKRVDQNDFMVARIGIGKEPLKVEIGYQEKDFTIEEDAFRKRIEEMIEKYKYIENVPIGYSFYENNITAVMGESVKCHYFVDNILFQLLTFYSYDDLKLVVFTNEKNKSHWEYVKYLNHNMTNDNNFRFFASTEDSAALVIDVLNQEIAARIQNNMNREKKLYKPYYLIIVDDISIIKKNNIIEQLTELKTNIGFSAIILERKLSKLPSLCTNFINIGEKTSGVLKNSYEKQEQIFFQNEINNGINMMEVAKVLSNIPIEFSAKEEPQDELPDSITFLEMAKVGKVEQLNIMNRWTTNDSTSSLKAEVGVSSDGKLMYLDLHEKAHGPHGLIAGMTGSGKSEFIITWILSLSMNFSPEDVAFILIDYKGGGLAFAFENQLTGVRLPHLAGTITNLDKAEIDRTLVSIDSEVKRRQKIFNEARARLGESTIDIYKYQGFYHEGRLSEPLPHLFIVCDEFAELKAQQPEFMDNLISVARIGRSLGVHLILATQKPSGVVNDQIWSNTKFRICLKVQDASDSNEMLKKPDAASLKQTGRFYLQVGYDEYFALGQSGWCGAKYYPSDILQKSVDRSVNVLDETGITIKSIQAGTSSAKKAEAEGEQLAAILKEIIKVATENNKFVRKLWLDNIPSIITIEGTEKKYNFEHKKDNFDMIIGEYDAPENQQQLPLIYNLQHSGNTYIVGTDSQEAEALINAILYNVMKNYLPTEVSYYIIDYGSQNFLKNKKDPHCGGIVVPGDGESFTNLMKLILSEQRQRKKILSDFGGEYTDYIKKHPHEMPIMLVIFNNYESIYDANQSLYDIFGELLRDSDRYGIVYITSASMVDAVPDRFKQLMSTFYALKLNNPGDYGYFFHVSGKKAPKELFGRGICFQETMHEFQTAFICEDRSNENKVIMNLLEELSQKNLTPAKQIPTLPEQVMLKDVERRLKGIKKIPVGIEKGTLAIKTIDLTADVGKLIVGVKLKYTKFFVKSIIDEIIYLKMNLIILDPTELLIEEKSKVVNYFSSGFDDKIDKVIEFVQKQEEKEEEKHTVVIINSIMKLIGKLENSGKISELFDKFRTLSKAHILIIDEYAKIKDAAYESWFSKIDTTEGVYIGTGVDSQTIFKVNGFNKELSQTFPKNYGFYMIEGACHIIKLLEFEKMGDDEDDEE